MTRILSLLISIFIGLTVEAVPARRSTFSVTQPDGSVITLQLIGDEHFHFYRNVETGEAMIRTEDGSYAVIDATTLAERQKNGVARRNNANIARLSRLNNRRSAPQRVGEVTTTITGSKKGLVILVNFQDVALNKSHTNATFDNMFNKEGYNEDDHIGSVHDFFHDQSYGNFDLSFDVVGPVTVKNNMSYYGKNDSEDSDSHPAEMVIEACKLAYDGGTDFSNYDWDGDGEVDQVYVIYAGYGEAYSGADPNTIWPHEWTLNDARAFGDGTGRLKLGNTYVDTYACSSELRGTSGANLSPIGTACHEFSHCLGFPDMYDVDYSGAFGMNAFDLMDSGSYNGPKGYGEVPSGYTAYERWAAGWLNLTELTTATNVKDLRPIGDVPEACIFRNPNASNEYVLLENRQPTRWFSYIDRYNAGKGLLAIHVDYNATVWANNSVNDTPSHQRMTIIPAGGTYGTYRSDYEAWYPTEAQYRSMTFPGSKNITALTEDSHASTGGKWFNSTKTLGHSLTEITESKDGLISFLFDGGLPEDDGSRHTVLLRAGTGTTETKCWKQEEFLDSFVLPNAVVSPEADEWEFIGWSATPATPSELCPKPIYTKGSTFLPTADTILYAIYKARATDGEAPSLSGSYTLDYTTDKQLQGKTMAYGKPFEYEAPDGGKWIIKCYKNQGMQINSGKNASIKVPTCPAPITSVVITNNQEKSNVNAVLRFSTDDYTGNNSPNHVYTLKEGSGTMDLSEANLTTGYIYDSGSADVITKIVVNYGDGHSSGYIYDTYPGGTANPTIERVTDCVFLLPTGATTPNKIMSIADELLTGKDVIEETTEETEETTEETEETTEETEEITEETEEITEETEEITEETEETTEETEEITEETEETTEEIEETTEETP